MKREIWDEIVIPALADRKGWALFIGTPKGINLFSDLYFRALVDPDWSAAKYTIHDTKVFTPEEIESIKAEMVAAAGSDRTWRQEMLCDFLASDDNALISIDEANAAANRIIKESEYQFAPRILGVDVAWSGGDRSVIFPRQGLVAFPPIVEHGLPEKAFAVTVARAIEKFQAQATFIDNTGGYGGEVVSRLRDGGHKIYPVNFAWKPSDPRFLNLRAEIWFKMADWVKNGGSIPNRPSLISEMCAPTFSNDNAANKMKLESKDDVKDRLGVSPDEADALALTWAFPVVAPLALGTARAGVYQAKTEYDMYGEGL